MAGKPDKARKALVLHERQLVVDLIELTLNHGLFVVRAATSLAEAEEIISDWQPDLAVIDMDHDDSGGLLRLLGASTTLKRSTIPALGLTRRGDLKTKLRAFDLGVDDILTMPFSPEELLARSIVITRRSLGADHPIVPTIRLGEMEIDIVNRQVRAGTSVVHLSGIEQSLLYLLASRGGRVVTRDEILDAIWGTTSWLRATSSIAMSAACGSSSRTTTGTRDSLPRWRAVATDSSRGFPMSAGTAVRIRSRRRCTSRPARPHARHDELS